MSAMKLINYRSSSWPLIILAAMALAAASGCGGGSSSGSQPPLAGDACVPDADLTTVQVPDASIGDSGVTVGDCYDCVLSSCQAELAACNKDCICNPEVAGLMPCLASGSKIGECATQLNGELALRIWGCLDQNCRYACSGQPDSG